MAKSKGKAGKFLGVFQSREGGHTNRAVKGNSLMSALHAAVKSAGSSVDRIVVGKKVTTHGKSSYVEGRTLKGYNLSADPRIQCFQDANGNTMCHDTRMERAFLSAHRPASHRRASGLHVARGMQHAATRGFTQGARGISTVAYNLPPTPGAAAKKSSKKGSGKARSNPAGRSRRTGRFTRSR